MAGGSPGSIEIMAQCRLNVGPPSAMLTQHKTNRGRISLGGIYRINCRFQSSLISIKMAGYRGVICVNGGGGGGIDCFIE